jgi:Family of unknown function (DUF6174)
VRFAVAAVLALGLLLAAPTAGQSPPGPTIPRDEPDPSITSGGAQHRLDTARHRWRRAGIHNYRFSVETICFCPPGAPQVLFVRNDRPLEPPAALRDVATIRRLQRTVQRAIDGKVAGLAVRYDHRGVPRRISIDGRRSVADDEVTYRVPKFWRGIKGHGGPAPS